MTRYFLGVDIGGTKCHALIADESGCAVGFGQYGPGNYESVGWDGLRAALHAITGQVLTHAGISRAQLAGAGFGVAGYDWPSERGPHLEAIASLNLSVPCDLVNDTLIGLVAGTDEGWGVSVVAGTGANCWGRDRAGRVGRVTGEGHWFDEYGGGGDLVIRALQAVSRAWSSRGPETRLAEAFVAHMGVGNVEEFIEGLCVERFALDGSLAPLVFRVAAEGDEVALDCVRWLGAQLGDLAVGVIRQLAFERETFDLVQVGSMFNGSPLLSTSLMEVVNQVAPQARAVRLAAPPVIGAVLLGMAAAGVDFRPCRAPLIESTQALFVRLM